MGNLAVDTAVEHLDERRYRANLSTDWNLVGPNGGYLAAIALRAAAAATCLARPASISCQFLAPARFGAVELSVVELRATRQTAALRVSMTQQTDQHLLEALVLAADPELAGPQRSWLPMPAAPGPDELVDLKSDLASTGAWVPPWHDSVNLRVASNWRAGPRGGGEAPTLTWCRFRPTATFDDPWLDACRALILVDSLPWPAIRVTLEQERTLALTMHLSVDFHGAAATAEWLLVQAHGCAAGLGFTGGVASVWAPDGRLVASGTQQLLLHELTRGNRLDR